MSLSGLEISHLSVWLNRSRYIAQGREVYLQFVDVRLNELKQIIFVPQISKKTGRRHEHTEDVPASNVNLASTVVI